MASKVVKLRSRNTTSFPAILKGLIKPILPLLVRHFGSPIRDARTGNLIGRAILVPWKGTIRVVGLSHAFVMPRFAPVGQTFYWHQTIEFSTHPPVDYPRLDGISNLPGGRKSRILWLIIAHQDARTVEAIMAYWENYTPAGDVLIAYGGASREEFARIRHSQKVFIEDSRLRTRAHVLEKQSYTGVLRAAHQWLKTHDPYTHVYLAESDLFPVSADISRNLLTRLNETDADVLFYHLKRADLTNWCHLLYHQSFPGFVPFLSSLSRRPEKEVVLNAIGCGSFWTRAAFEAVAAVNEYEPVYLEFFLPSAAHHLGFRVVEFSNQNQFISVIPKNASTVRKCKTSGALFVHPVKNVSELPEPLRSVP
jgi:hypothetical protein